jgi:Copper transport outer membrane protein, MctB
MLDYRYHALSLAAVLFALALGVLIGVAIGDSNLVSSAKRGIVHNLDSEISSTHSQLARQGEELDREEAFVNGLYPLAVHELLARRHVGLLFLGGASERVDTLVRDAVTEAGGEVASVVAVGEPLDLAGISHDAAGTSFASLGSAPSLIGRFGYVVGRQLVSGGPLVDRELVSRVRSNLLSAFDGQLTRLDGLVVVRADPEGMSAAQSEASSAFEGGLLSGVAAAKVISVGAQTTGADPSQIAWYKGKGLSSVDDLDTVAGRAALAYALAGEHGTYGSSSTADALLPSVGGSATAP